MNSQARGTKLKPQYLTRLSALGRLLVFNTENGRGRFLPHSRSSPVLLCLLEALPSSDLGDFYFLRIPQDIFK